MVGALAGGWISDRWALRGRSRFEPQAMALLCAAVPVDAGNSANIASCERRALSCRLFSGSYEGTLAVALYDMVGPKQRSSNAAVVLLLANLLSAPSAALLGWIADHADLSQLDCPRRHLFRMTSIASEVSGRICTGPADFTGPFQKTKVRR